MKFKIGDRVLIKSEQYSKNAIILMRLLNKNGIFRHDKGASNRYFIKCLDIYNVNATLVEKWVGEDQIEFDLNYYIELRNTKLEKLGI